MRIAVVARDSEAVSVRVAVRPKPVKSAVLAMPEFVY